MEEERNVFRHLMGSWVVKERDNLGDLDVDV
jgi:hypothetical protein